METPVDNLLPVRKIALAIILGALPPLILFALIILLGVTFGNDPQAAWRTIGTFALFALASAVIVGIPVGTIFLRDPMAPMRRWIAAGAGSRLIAVTLVEFWFAGPSFSDNVPDVHRADAGADQRRGDHLWRTHRSVRAHDSGLIVRP